MGDALQAFAGKTVVLMGAGLAGRAGGLRALVHVRATLGNINALILPEQLAVPKAHEAFNADGSLKDAKPHAMWEGPAKSWRTSRANWRNNGGSVECSNVNAQSRRDG